MVQQTKKSRSRQAKTELPQSGWKSGTVEEISQQVGASLRRWRERRGMSLAQTAPLVRAQGVSCDGSYLSRMELGGVNIPMRTLIAICRVLRVSPRYILSKDFPTTETVLDAMPRSTLRLLIAVWERDERLLGTPLNAALVSILESINLQDRKDSAAAKRRK
ncbi:MAG: helix-turn-helix transcriptional regulator [Leptospirales bacterium]